MNKKTGALLEQYLQPLLKDLVVTPSFNIYEKLEQYIELLEKWNQVYNLTAAKNTAEIITHHILDSMVIFPYITGPKVLDVGSGAGFPGIPLALLLPDFAFVLLDSSNKRIRFLTQVVADLKLQNVSLFSQRVEECHLQECFATIVTRATFSVSDMVTKSQHLLSQDGKILLMKGKDPCDEVLAVADFLKTKVIKINVPFLEAERHLVVVSRAISS